MITLMTTLILYVSVTFYFFFLILGSGYLDIALFENELLVFDWCMHIYRGGASSVSSGKHDV